MCATIRRIFVNSFRRHLYHRHVRYHNQLHLLVYFVDLHLIERQLYLQNQHLRRYRHYLQQSRRRRYHCLVRLRYLKRRQLVAEEGQNSHHRYRLN